MNRDRLHFLLLNVGHLLDHLFMLIFATVAALALSREWGVSYSALLAYATPGFFAFGLFSLPAGWIADKWNREAMMSVFYFGIGLAAIATGFAQSPLQVGVGLFVIGMFAAIYHPVGLAIVTAKWKNTGSRLAVNGVWGNLGVAGAALLTGYMIDQGGWRSAFILPGVFSLLMGMVYTWARWPEVRVPPTGAKATVAAGAALSADTKALLVRISIIVFATTAVSSIIFQSTTFALPKIFDERLQGVARQMVEWFRESRLFGGTASTASMVGGLAFTVFAVASMAQLVVGRLLDRYGPRPVFMAVASLQVICFALMPGLQDAAAVAVALGFMLGAFGQIPINDFMVGKMAVGEFRARAYGVRYVVSFTALAATLPLISIVYARWGFDVLFWILSATALVILLLVSLLPKKLPAPA